MVGIASSSKFLISPVIGGLLLAATSMEVIITIDILTLFVTIGAVFSVRKSLAVKSAEKKELNFFKDLHEGWKIVSSSKGVLQLIVLVSVLMFYMGFIQVLAKPMCLPFASEKTTGIMQTVCACGMLVSSIMLVTHDSKVAVRTERVLFMLDGKIVAEKKLGKYDAQNNDVKQREESIMKWLVENGF